MIEVLHVVVYMLLGAYLLGFFGTLYLSYREKPVFWPGALILALCWPILFWIMAHEAVT